MENVKEELTFEEAYSKLEAVVAQLENGQNSLEASLKLYQEGRELSDICRKILEKSEITLKEIRGAADERF